MSSSTGNLPVLGDQKASFLTLMISLLLLLILVPLSRPLPLVFTIISSLVVVSGLSAVLNARWLLTFVVPALLVCLPLRWAAHFWGSQVPALILASYVAVGAYFAVLAVVVLIQVIVQPQITQETVIGSICGYLLIGFVFTFCFASVTYFDPKAIMIGGQPLEGARDNHLAELVYFSFITLTTVGYGDIAPVCPVARMMAVVEALAGQLYLAAFVARLIGTMPNRSSTDRK